MLLRTSSVLYNCRFLPLRSPVDHEEFNDNNDHDEDGDKDDNCDDVVTVHSFPNVRLLL